MKSDAQSIYSFEDYKLYLKFCAKNRGFKKDLADYIPVRSAFLSQVLNDDAQFSIDHAYKASSFLGLNEKQTEYFLNLVSQEKVSSVKLKAFYQRRNAEIIRKEVRISSLLPHAEALSFEDSAVYYSSWYYSAIHILTALSEFDTVESLSQHLQLPRSLVKDAAAFLVSKGLLNERQGKLSVGKTRIHISKNSQLFKLNHTNWRLESIRALNRPKDKNLHYTSVLALNKKDFLKLNELIQTAILGTEKILTETSHEDAVAVLNIDLFQIS